MISKWLSNDVIEKMYPSHKRWDEDRLVLVFLTRRISMLMSFFIWARLAVSTNIITLMSVLIGVLGSIFLINQLIFDIYW